MYQRRVQEIMDSAHSMEGLLCCIEEIQIRLLPLTEEENNEIDQFKRDAQSMTADDLNRKYVH